MKLEQSLLKDYIPSENEPFMNDVQVEYFRKKLFEWKNSILDKSRPVLTSLDNF